MATDDQLTTSQTARELSVSSVYARRLADEGRIPVVVTPLGRLYDAAAVRILAAERTARQQRRDSGN